MKQVLLIDASPLFREFLRQKLEDEQIFVETATGNRDAFTKMLAILPDLVVINVENNFDNLHDFLERKYVDPNAKSIPIIISGPVIPRYQIANLALYAVIKYFTKPIKFDIFFNSIADSLKTTLTIDLTPCVLEIHTNGNVIFIEVAQGLNLEKLNLLKYRLAEIIEQNNLTNPKVIVMLSAMNLTFVDGSNLELLFDNIIKVPQISRKNIKVLSLNKFVQNLLAGHPRYHGIEIVQNIIDILNSVVDGGSGTNSNEIIIEKILNSDANDLHASLEMRFGTDNAEGVILDSEDTGNILKVAIVDDDIVIRTLLEKAFLQINAEVKLFDSGVKFMQQQEKESFDLVILDIYIPDMNGFDILRSLQRKNFNAPILVYSQATMKESVVKALSLGARSYMVKPQKTDAIVKKAIDVLHSMH